MMPMVDPRTAMRRFVLMAAAVMTAAALVAWCWACASLTDAPSSAPAAPPPVVSVAGAVVVDPTLWDRSLWHRIGPPPVVAPQPIPIKLFSLMNRNGRLVAVIDPGDSTGLVYAKPGDVVKGVLVKSIAANAVEVEWEHQPRTLAIGP